MEKYGFVYIWRDKKHKRYYIGCHWGTEDDGYVSSSPWLMRAYKRRPQDFHRRILERTKDRTSTFVAEQKWLDLIRREDLKVKYYNLHTRVSDYWHKYNDKRLTIGQKISASVKAHRETPEGQANYLAGIEKKRGRKQSPEAIAKRSAGIKNAMAVKFPVEERKQVAKKGSEEHSKKLSDASKKRWADPLAKEKQAAITRSIHTGNKYNVGRVVSEETRLKISEANRGRTKSPEHIEKLRQQSLGRLRSESAKAATSEKMKQVWAERKQLKIAVPK